MNDAAALRERTVVELAKEVRALRDELFRTRFQHATQQLKDPNRLRTMRRDLARMKTILTEKTSTKVVSAKTTKSPKKDA